MMFNCWRSRRFAIIGALLAVAGGAAFWVARPAVPFDEAFQGCKEEEAEWRLVVNYSVNGLSDNEEFVAHFCRRQNPKIQVVSGSWLRWWEPTVFLLEDVGGTNCRMTATYACGGGGGYSQHSSVFAWERKSGVDLNIEHTLSRKNDEVTVEETVMIPIPKPVTGHKGKIKYRARWEQTPAAG